MPMLVITIALAKILERIDKALVFCLVSVQDFGVVALVELPKSKCNFKAWNTKMLYIRMYGANWSVMKKPVEANIFTFIPADVA